MMHMNPSERYVKRRSKRDMLDGLEGVSTSKLIDRNTVRYTRESGEIVTRFHLTDIVTVCPQGGVCLTTDGWRTVTTRARICSVLLELKVPWRLWQEKGEWYIGQPSRNRRYLFQDGVTVFRNGKVFGAASNTDQTKRKDLRKEINRYSRLVMKGYDYPSGEDCPQCFELIEGEKQSDTTHLIQHVINDDYVQGAVVWNALRWIGYNPEVYFQLGRAKPLGTEVRAVRRYLLASLGLVV